MNEPSAAAPARPKRHRERVAGAIARIAADIDHDAISPGDRAALRRGWESGPGPAFWRLAVHRLEPLDLAVTKREEEGWSIVVAGIAHTYQLPRSGPKFGAAAATAKVAEMRLLRLLRSEGPTLHRILRGVVHQLAQAGLGFDWLDPALLVLRDGQPRRREIERRIAKDYYRSLPRETEA